MGIDTLVCNFKIHFLWRFLYQTCHLSWHEVSLLHMITSQALIWISPLYFKVFYFSCRHLLKKTGLHLVIHFQIAWGCQLYLEVLTCPLNYPGSHQVGVSHHHPCASHLDHSHLRLLLHMHKLLTTTLPYSCRCVLKWFLEIIEVAGFHQLSLLFESFLKITPFQNFGSLKNILFILILLDAETAKIFSNVIVSLW